VAPGGAPGGIRRRALDEYPAPVMFVLIAAASPGPPCAENNGNCAEGPQSRTSACPQDGPGRRVRIKSPHTAPHAARAEGRPLALLAGYVHAAAGLGLDEALGTELADGALDRSVRHSVALHEGPGGGQELAGLDVACLYLRAQEIRELPPDRRAGLMIDLHVITVSG
jgi:hypothetical protein